MMQTSVWIYVLSKYNLSAASEFAKQMQQKRKKYVAALRGRLPAEPPISDWLSRCLWNSCSIWKQMSILCRRRKRFWQSVMQPLGFTK